MEVTISENGPFKVVALSGEVDLHTSPGARRAILDSLRAGRPVLVDLSDVGYMDSSGVASLVEGFQQARKASLEFGLAAVSLPAMNVLRLARLDKVFPIHASVAARIARQP
ncbi:MAG TPA: STAS domain-containing protein [Burkholderiales bacterium]